jgi:hypothetical protein
VRVTRVKRGLRLRVAYVGSDLLRALVHARRREADQHLRNIWPRGKANKMLEHGRCAERDENMAPAFSAASSNEDATWRPSQEDKERREPKPNQAQNTTPEKFRAIATLGRKGVGWERARGRAAGGRGCSGVGEYPHC